MSGKSELYQRLSRQYGVPAGSCAVCDSHFLVENGYTRMGLCSECARKAGAAWKLAHSGEPDMMLDPEGYREHVERQPKRYKKQIIGHAVRKKVFERDGYRCKLCDSHLDLQVDHIHPEKLGGTLDLENLQTLCRPCNSSKGARVA